MTTTHYDSQQLANMSDLCDIASPDSPAAHWLDSIQDDVNEVDMHDGDIETAARQIAAARCGHSGGFTSGHEMWSVFIELGLWVKRFESLDVPEEEGGGLLIDQPDDLAYAMLEAAATIIARALLIERRDRTDATEEEEGEGGA